MHIVIAGIGRVGSELARRTSLDGHDVVAIDKQAEAFERLGSEFNGETMLGEAFDISILRGAGIEIADVFLAVTSSDNVNLMSTEVVRRLFKHPRAIARLYDPARQSSYQALGIEYITGTQLIANVIYEQVISEDFQFHVTFPEGDVEIIDFTLSAEANGMSLNELEVRNKLRVAAIHRNRETIIPNRRFILAEGDLVVAAARDGVQNRIDHLIQEQG